MHARPCLSANGGCNSDAIGISRSANAYTDWTFGERGATAGYGLRDDLRALCPPVPATHAQSSLGDIVAPATSAIDRDALRANVLRRLSMVVSCYEAGLSAPTRPLHLSVRMVIAPTGSVSGTPTVSTTASDRCVDHVFWGRCACRRFDDDPATVSFSLDLLAAAIDGEFTDTQELVHRRQDSTNRRHLVLAVRREPALAAHASTVSRGHSRLPGSRRFDTQHPPSRASGSGRTGTHEFWERPSAQAYGSITTVSVNPRPKVSGEYISSA